MKESVSVPDPSPIQQGTCRSKRVGDTGKWTLKKHPKATETLGHVKAPIDYRGKWHLLGKQKEQEGETQACR